MKPFDITVALRVIIGRAPMSDSQAIQSFDETRGSELCSVVGGQGHAGIAAALRQTREHGLLHRVKCFLRSASMRQIPAHDFPCTTVNYTHQIGPAYRWARPDLSHIRLPDLIWLCGFHAPPLLLPSCSQT